MIMSTKEICKRGLSMTISLTLGNTRLPFTDGLVGDGEARRQFALREPQRAAAPGDELTGLLFVKAVHALTSPSF